MLGTTSEAASPGEARNDAKSREGVNMSIFDGKKVVVLGERDGVSGTAIEACVKAAGADVAFTATECFV
jgi:betaine reductase